MTARELARLLHGRKESGYFLCRCPVHDDRSPSLSVRDRDKKVRIKCFAGCDPRVILSTLGLTFRDLGYDSDPQWKQRLNVAAVKPAGKRKPLGKLEATYRYTDEREELVAEKLRYDGKVFLWRRPQAGGGWLWKVDRTSLPLYRLHEVAAMPNVILVEGEKDADNLARRIVNSTAVTTAPNGAKSWRPEFAEYFREKKVWIVPDFDEPGRLYAQTVANQIARVCACVRVVSIAPCKDVSDYLQNHSSEELGILFRRAPRWGVN